MTQACVSGRSAALSASGNAAADTDQDQRQPDAPARHRHIKPHLSLRRCLPANLARGRVGANSERPRCGEGLSPRVSARGGGCFSRRSRHRRHHPQSRRAVGHDRACKAPVAARSPTVSPQAASNRSPAGARAIRIVRFIGYPPCPARPARALRGHNARSPRLFPSRPCPIRQLRETATQGRRPLLSIGPITLRACRNPHRRQPDPAQRGAGHVRIGGRLVPPGPAQAHGRRRQPGCGRRAETGEDPGRFLSTVQIGITLVGVLSGAFSGATLGARLSGWLAAQGVTQQWADWLGVGGVVVLLTYLSLIVGELVPKQIALKNPEQIASRVAPAMTLLSRIGAPLVWLTRRLRPISPRAAWPGCRRQVARHRRRGAHASGRGPSRGGHRDRRAGDAVGRHALADRSARALMTPRRDVELLDLSATHDETLAAIRRIARPRDSGPGPGDGRGSGRAVPDRRLRGTHRRAPARSEGADARGAGSSRTAPTRWT